MSIARADLGKLTFGKGAVNTGIRWLPFFLPTLAVAFATSEARLALLLGVAEASGLTTYFVGQWLDAGRERLVIVAAMGALAASSMLALIGDFWLLAAAMVLLGAASGHVTVAGHAWISARVSFARRARFIGIFEISWASAMLVGVPIIAALIAWFDWRAPFVAVAVAAIVAAGLVWTIDDGRRKAGSNVRTDVGARARTPLTRDAWIVIGISASTALAGLTTIAVAGTWLDKVLGVSTGGIGLVAMAFGAAELVASLSSSAFADRFGKRRTMQFSIACTLVGLAVVASAGTSLLVGAVGLVIFFVGFEYSIVTSFSLVSEAMPEARGRALGIGNATSTVARGLGVASSGFLYDAFGVRGPVVLSVIAALFCFALLAVIAQRRPDLA